MTGIATAIGAAISFAFAMSWEILWALVLGFGLSAIVQAVVSKSEMSRLLPDDSPRTLMIAACLGAASSSRRSDWCRVSARPWSSSRTSR